MSKRPSLSSLSTSMAKRTRTPLTEKEKQQISNGHAQGLGATEIAKLLDRSVGTVYYYIKNIRQQNAALEAAMEMTLNSEAGSIDGDDLGVFRDKLEQGGYSSKQVLSFQETGLVWKMMSQLTNMSGFQADRVTLVIGGNAEGDWKLKPLLVYHTENPRALRGYIKGHFPVVWKAHPQVLVTDDFLQSYVVDYLSAACKEYAMDNNLPNKFLLILDSHSAHPSSMNQWADNIEVLFLPPFMQPMGQGVADIFKRYYHRRVMQQLVKAHYTEKITTEEFWRQYNIKKAIHNISHSWNQVKQSIMNAVWYEVWPEAVPGQCASQGVEGRRQQLIKDIVRFSHQAGMSQVNADGIETLFASHADVPSEEEHAQLEPEETEDPDPPQQTPGLNKEELKELLDAINKASVIAETQDLNMSRSDEFSQALERAIARYQKMYDDL